MSSASQQLTADGWVRHLAAHPNVRVKTPATHKAAIPDRHQDWWNRDPIDDGDYYLDAIIRNQQTLANSNATSGLIITNILLLFIPGLGQGTAAATTGAGLVEARAATGLAAKSIALRTAPMAAETATSTTTSVMRSRVATVVKQPEGLAQIAKPRLTFGHGARHLKGTGLATEKVESVITDQVAAATTRSMTRTGTFWGRVEVSGTTIEYRAYTLADGTINVGTYYVP